MTADRFDKFTDRAQKVLQYAQEEAERLRHNYIGTEHILLGLVREEKGVASHVLRRLGVDLELLRSAVEFIIGRGDRTLSIGIGLTPRAKKALELAIDEAEQLGHSYIGTEHLLLGLVREGEGVAVGVLESFHVKLDDVRAEVLATLSGGTLREFGTPLLTPGDVAVVAREPQIERVIEVLLRRSRHHPVLVGSPHSGRMDVVRGLAARVADAQIPVRMPFRRIVVLDVEHIQALPNALVEAETADILLCLPDMERLPEDALVQLLSAVAHTGVRVLGLTTPLGFDTLSARHPLVAELFEPVLVPELPADASLQPLPTLDVSGALRRTFAAPVAEVLVNVFEGGMQTSPTRALLVFAPAGAHTHQFTRSLADALFGSAAALVELDLSTDIGHVATYPPGRVWFYQPSHTSVAEALRRRPATVLRLSHAEHATPAALDLIEYVLRTGLVTDPQGRRLDLTRAVIVVTAARGARLDSRLLRVLPTQMELTRGWSLQGR